MIINNTILNSCENTTFTLVSGDEDYTITVYANDTLGNQNEQSLLFGIRTDSPAIVLDNPTSNQFFNRLTEIKFNFTATDTSGIDDGVDSVDICQLWGNFTGTWLLNQTISSVTSGTQKAFNSLNLTESSFIWNVWCNDTLGNSDFALTNHTFTTDITYPKVNISSPLNGSSITGLATILDYNLSDAHLGSCFFTLRNSSGAVHNYAENTSLSCSELGSRAISVTNYGTYNLTIFARDSAGNENLTTISFTMEASGSTGTGGGSTPEESKYSVIGILLDTTERVYTSLEKEVIYSQINKYCSEQKTESTLAITDYSGECSLTTSDLKVVNQKISELGFSVTESDLISFFRSYNEKKLFQGFETLDNIKKYSLFTSVLGITNPLTITPPSLDRPFFIFRNDGNISLEYKFSVNKNIKSCAVISESNGLSCVVLTNSTFKVTQKIDANGFFTKVFQGEVSVTSDAKQEMIEIRNIRVVMRAYNLSYKWKNIPVIIFPISLIILVSLFFVMKKYKVWWKS